MTSPSLNRKSRPTSGRRCSKLLHRNRGLVLIEGTPDWGTVCEVIQRARATVGVEITAIAENAAVRDIAAAQATTHELAQLVRRLRLPARSYRMEDLALEYQLTRGGAGRDSLINLLKPLDGNPELLQTLSIHLANGQHRQRTASALGLHTNTVDNRIKRIATLTGLDPALPSELLQTARCHDLADLRKH